MSNDDGTGSTIRPIRRIDPRVLAGGCPVIGLGIGLALGNPGVGVLLGVGAGFVLRAVATGKDDTRPRDRQ